MVNNLFVIAGGVTRIERLPFNDVPAQHTTSWEKIDARLPKQLEGQHSILDVKRVITFGDYGG